MSSTKDLIANKKIVKDQQNRTIRSDDKIPHNKHSLDRLRELYLKTEEMKTISQTKNKELESQFAHLKERLSNSSGFLTQIKKNIEDIKYSYERDIRELEKVTEENRSDIDNQIEELKQHIHKLQSKSGKAERNISKLSEM